MSDNLFQNTINSNQESNTSESKKKRKSCDVQSGSNASKKAKSQYKRKNIKKIISDDALNEFTLKALLEEQERQKRLQENQVASNSLDDESSENGGGGYDEDDECDSSSDSHSNTIYLNDSNEDLNENDDILLLDTSCAKPATFLANPIKLPCDNGNDSDDCQIISDTEIENSSVSVKSNKTTKGVHTNDKLNVADSMGRVLVNVNHVQHEPDVFVASHLSKNIKAHQIGGIRFLFDNIIESTTRAKEPNSTGFGCILAHSMGLGKTFQIVTFTEIFFRCTPFKSVLCIVPINTIQNWLAEYNRWLPCDDLSSSSYDYRRPFQVFIINDNHKTFNQRSDVVLQWKNEGGVLLIGYEMFRTLISSTKEPVRRKACKKSTIVDLEFEDKNVALKEQVKNALLSPSLVVCDEGHRIKNSSASTAKALQSIHTRRRIVLTGYPLQNNLIEYWCMVNFVRPAYLGTKTEFSNMFEKPIINGQCTDSTLDDIRLMKYRSHVLHSLLEGFVQRRGHDVFLNSLPKKEELVILTKLTQKQKDLYLGFMRSVGAMIQGEKVNPLRAFAICCKIWNHPDVLFNYVSNKEQDIDLDLPELTAPLDKKLNDHEWALCAFENYQEKILENGTKFCIAFSLIDQSIQAGDKLLLFSQSLLSLNLIEDFLKERYVPDGSNQKWEKYKSYYRLDGSTNGCEREKLINAFNDPFGTAWLFLLSTRAGCLGINLIGANRVIMLDASFNPCHDAQAVCRVYRYGQKKDCFIYRLIADHTMEKKIYDRQISKQTMSDRVVDEIQTQNHFSRTEVEKLIHYVDEEVPHADLNELHLKFDDHVLINACLINRFYITKEPFKHESLLLDKKDYQLSHREKRFALQHFEQEKSHSFSYSRNTHSAHYPRDFQRVSSSYTSTCSNDDVIYQSSYKPPLTPQNYSSTYDTRNSPVSNLGDKGISVHSFITKRAFTIPFMEQKQVIQAGVRVILLSTPKGWYMRTPEGKLFAIRNPHAFLSELSNQYDNQNQFQTNTNQHQPKNLCEQDFMLNQRTTTGSTNNCFMSPTYQTQSNYQFINQNFSNSQQNSSVSSSLSSDSLVDPNQQNSSASDDPFRYCDLYGIVNMDG